MTGRLDAVWNFLTQPFSLFLIALVLGAVIFIDYTENRKNKS